MKIKIIDLKASFEPDGVGYTKNRIVDRQGKEWLNHRMWEIGECLYEALCAGNTSDFEKNYQDGFSLAEAAEAEFITPMMLNLEKQGRVNVVGDSGSDFCKVWGEYDVVTKFAYLIRAIENSMGHFSFLPTEVWSLLKHPIACLAIRRLEDAVLSEFFDNDGLLENVEEVEILFNQLERKAHVQAIERSALAARSKKGSDTTNSKHHDNQDFVFKWLEANYLQGMKHKEMAVTLVPLLDGEREYETILKDITEWKKKRKR